MSNFVFTCGDINGIGPEIVIKTINKKPPSKTRKYIFICPQNVFLEASKIISPNFSYTFVKKNTQLWDYKIVQILDLGSNKINVGKATKISGKISYNSIITACELASVGIADSIITSPISKFAFSKAGINFPGHTELLADYFNVKDYLMLFVSDKIKCGLITIHIPIKDIVQNISISKISSSVNLILESLKNDFNIVAPRIAILGLNPHAGENGRIGNEEIEIIEPVVKKFKRTLFGPFVPDAFFANRLFKNYDFTIGLYHDQLLIPFKYMSFNKGVNYTAGLPIVRTSPDHGTAFDIAGKGIASADSMIESLKLAEKIVKNRKAILEHS